MILRIVTVGGSKGEWLYEACHAPRLADALAEHWNAIARITVRDGNVTWIVKP
jgi:hypothetical protein